ncbi:MAG TPA: GTPase, partial [Ilumatobacteraceae bacterium]
MSDSDWAALPLVKLAQQTEELRAQLVETLQSSGNEALIALADSTPSAASSDSVCLVFVGQYNAGKSSIINCLTGLDLPVGSDVTTNTASAHSWFGHLVVDTPGVHAGVDIAHDTATDRALDVADAVVFVLTSEGFDETSAAYFRELLARLRGDGQLIVVVNKAHSEDSERDEILADLRTVYSGIDGVIQLVWVEARDWLTANAYAEPEVRRRRSNVAGLAAAIDVMTHRGGAQLRLATPLRELSRHVRKAIDLVVGTEHRGALEALDRLADEIDERRGDLVHAVTVAVGHAEHDLATKLIAAGPSHLPELIDEAIADVQANFVAEINARADKVAQEASKALTIFEASAPVAPAGSSIAADVWPRLRDQVLSGLRLMTYNFQGANARPGGVGHAIVTRAWHGVGGKFKPWGAVKAAENVGKVGRVGGVALVIGEGAVGVW